jgi:hypothetical protein
MFYWTDILIISIICSDNMCFYVIDISINSINRPVTKWRRRPCNCPPLFYCDIHVTQKRSHQKGRKMQKSDNDIIQYFKFWHMWHRFNGPSNGRRGRDMNTCFLPDLFLSLCNKAYILYYWCAWNTWKFSFSVLVSVGTIPAKSWSCDSDPFGLCA